MPRNVAQQGSLGRLQMDSPAAANSCTGCSSSNFVKVTNTLIVGTTGMTTCVSCKRKWISIICKEKERKHVKRKRKANKDSNHVMYNQVKFPFPEEAQQTWFSFCCEH